MNRMKNIYIRILTVAIILCLILIAIIIWKPQQKLNGYGDCVKQSITEESRQYNYASNIRDSTVAPETCFNETAFPPGPSL